MKNFTLISVIVLSLHIGNSQAAGGGFQCLNFTTPDDPEFVLGFEPYPEACDIIRDAKVKYFPDITLLIDTTNPLPFPPQGFPLCYRAQFTGNLGSIPVIMTAYSGITETDLAEYNLTNGLLNLTAATALTINAQNSNHTSDRELGTVYTQDQILGIYPEIAPREYLTVVGGNKQFEQGKGHFVIEGDTFAPGTQVKGKLCFLGNLGNLDN